jgi:hypothetical protein
MTHLASGRRYSLPAVGSNQRRYHVDNINAAKGADARQWRIDKAIALFLEGKQR